MNRAGDDRVLGNSDRLLLALAEELKLPLLHVSQQTELYEQAHGLALDGIHASTQHALLLIDSYITLQTMRQQQLELEPVSVSSVLYEAARMLQPLAAQYNCQIDLQIDGRYAPVMSHRTVLSAALISMGAALITAVKQPNESVTLAAHKAQAAIVAGVFSSTKGLGDKVLQQGRALYGRARQPLQSFTPHPAAGIFIADDLLEMAGAELRVSQHKNQRGLATMLEPSRQLSLV